MATWNFAILVDAIAHAMPDRDAVVLRDRRLRWEQLASRSRALAWHLSTEAGVRAGDHVALVLSNCPEYLETFLAVRKLRAVPLGVGVAAGVNELHAVIDRSDARAVLCESATNEDVRTAVRRIPKRWRPVIVELGAPYEAAIAAATPPRDWELEIPTPDDLIAIAELDASAESATPGPTVLSVGPFADGDNFAKLLGALARKGRAVFLDASPFDAQRTWDAVRREGVTELVIGGDPQARPLLAALAPGDAGTLSALEAIASTGAPLSADVAAALVNALPHVAVLGADDARVTPSDDDREMVLPSEVERRLLKHSSIVDCVVLGISDARIGKFVVALVQVVDDHYLDEPELAAWCRAHLPASLTPSRFVVVDGIDRAPSGEVDESALRELAISRLLDGR